MTARLGIIREEAYYFLPQRQTKIMNEGWATYWHSEIMTQRAIVASELIDYADRASSVTASSVPGRSALFTTNTSPISRSPALAV